MSESTRPGSTAVLPAAGAGTRLRLGAKAMLPFPGRTLVEVIAEILLDGGSREVVVVLGAVANHVFASTSLGTTSAEKIRVVVNPDWRSGMASSLRLGVETAALGHDVMVALVDQPRLAVKANECAACHAPAWSDYSCCLRCRLRKASAWTSCAARRVPAHTGRRNRNGRLRGPAVPPDQPPSR